MAEPYDLLGPYRGICPWCHHPDARHRMADNIVLWYVGGLTVPELAEEFGLAEETIVAFIVAFLET